MNILNQKQTNSKRQITQKGGFFVGKNNPYYNEPIKRITSIPIPINKKTELSKDIRSITIFYKSVDGKEYMSKVINPKKILINTHGQFIDKKQG